MDFANARSSGRSAIRVTIGGNCDRLRIGAARIRGQTPAAGIRDLRVFVAYYFSCRLGLHIVGYYRMRFVSAPHVRLEIPNGVRNRRETFHSAFCKSHRMRMQSDVSDTNDAIGDRYRWKDDERKH